MSQKEPQQGLELVAKRLGEDYYPLAELLCKNARVQAEWLNEQNATTFTQAYSKLYTDLEIMVNRHFSMGRQELAIADTGLRLPGVAPEMKVSQDKIIKILSMLKSQDAIAEVVRWDEMQQNLRMKLRVINNILTEIFNIENKDVIPFFEGSK